MENKILIIGPYLHVIGGIAHYYKVLLSAKNINADYMEYGYCPERAKRLYQIHDIFTFLTKIRRYDTIHINPSLEKVSLIRDLLYVLIALLRKKKVFISFMGWDEVLYEKLSSNKLLKNIFVNILNHSTHITVPVPFFMAKLQKLGVKVAITLLYPPFDDKQNRISALNKNFNDRLGILFMARIEESKGIYKVLEIFEKLHSFNPTYFDFTICGDGSELENVKKIAYQKNIPIQFTGNVKGDDKLFHYNKNHLFVYPSHHMEGFPLVLAEVLRNGLITVSSDSGGIGGVLDDRNGKILDKNYPSDAYVQSILTLSNQVDLLKQISAYNQSFSEQKFSPINIGNQLNAIYKCI